MPCSLTLLILPLCLHKDTRDIISNNPRRYFLKIINDNPSVLVGFAERTRSLLPYTFEAFGFTMQLQSFKITNDGQLKLKQKGIRKKIDGTKESIDCQKDAIIIGKNFAKIGDRVTIYTTLGIRP